MRTNENKLKICMLLTLIMYQMKKKIKLQRSTVTVKKFEPRLVKFSAGRASVRVQSQCF